MAQLNNMGEPAAVYPGTSAAETLRTSAALTAAWVEGNILTTGDARWLHIQAAYTADGAGTNGYARIRVLLSADATAPAIGDDSWWAVPETDISPTDDATMAGALPAGFDADSVYGRVRVVGPLVLATEPASAGVVIRQALPAISISGYRWFTAICIEEGDAANPGTLALTYTLSL